MLSRTVSLDGRRLTSERHSIAGFGDVHLSSTPQIKGDLVTAVATALFCDYLLLTLCIPILPDLLKDQYSTFQIGLVFAAKPFFQFIANPFMGDVVVKVGPKQPLVIGCLILSFSTYFFAYGASLNNDLQAAYGVVMAARSIQGVASASIMSAGMTLLAQTHDATNRGEVMGMAMAGVAFGTLLGPPLGGILGYYINLWAPFLIIASVLLLLCGRLYYLFVQKKDINSISLHDQLISMQETTASKDAGDGLGQQEDTDNTGLTALLLIPQIFFVGCLAIIGNSAIGMLEPLIPIWLGDKFGTSIQYQGLIFGSATLSYLIFTPIAGTLSDKWEKWQCLCLGLVIQGIGMCLFSLANDIGIVCMCLALVGGGMAFIDTPILPLLADIVNLEFKNKAMLGLVYALNDMCLCIGFTLGPILGPVMEAAFGHGTKGFRMATLVVGCVCVCVSPLTYVMLKGVKSEPLRDESAVTRDRSISLSRSASVPVGGLAAERNSKL